MTKKKIRFNFVDVLIILAILASVFALVGAIGQRSASADGGSVKLRYIIRTDELSYGLENNFAVGDKLYSDDSQVYFGTVTDVEIRPAYHNGINENGETVVSRIEGRQTVYLTVECDAELTNHSYYIDGFSMYVGEKFSVITPNIGFSGECIEITHAD